MYLPLGLKADWGGWRQQWLRKSWKAWSAVFTDVTITRVLQLSSRTSLTSRDGSVIFRQQQRQGQLLLHESKLIPLPPFLSWRPPSANTSGFSASCASGQQGAHNRLSRSTFFKGELEVLCWPQQLVTQSPFSSSFCKLFCILKQ